MGCRLCLRLEAKLERLQRIYTDKSALRLSRWQTVTNSEYLRLRAAENESLLKVEIARNALNVHRRDEHHEPC